MDAPRSDLHPPAGSAGIPDSASLSHLLAYFIELLPAASRLAEDLLAVRHATRDFPPHYVCVNCGNKAAWPAEIVHPATCIVGEVLRLVGKILGLAPFSLDAQIRLLQGAQSASPIDNTLKVVEGVMQRHAFVPGEAFYEPWSIRESADSADEREILNALGNTVVDMYGATVPEEEEERYMRRIVACVNFCQGLSMRALEGALGGVGNERQVS